jgi:hypothetical protein
MKEPYYVCLSSYIPIKFLSHGHTILDHDFQTRTKISLKIVQKSTLH